LLLESKMGTASSKPDMPKAETNVAELKKEAPANVPAEASSSGIAKESESGGGCPMKLSDGSYSYDWKAMFQKHPHGVKGSKPLEKENINKNDNGNGGCPVKQYNVYSQPIDPNNQMPSVANQLPAPGQIEELSTSRVSSSISKVGAHYLERNPLLTVQISVSSFGFSSLCRAEQTRAQHGHIPPHKCFTMRWLEKVSLETPRKKTWSHWSLSTTI
jgi:Cytochrome c/c1 heme lyase